MHSGRVCFVIMMIMTYSFDKLLYENVNFIINNANDTFSLLMEYGITNIMLSRQNLENVHIFVTF